MFFFYYINFDETYKYENHISSIGNGLQITLCFDSHIPLHCLIFLTTGGKQYLTVCHFRQKLAAPHGWATWPRSCSYTGGGTGTWTQATCAQLGVLFIEEVLFKRLAGSLLWLIEWLISIQTLRRQACFTKHSSESSKGEMPWQISLPFINSSLLYIVLSIVCTSLLLIPWVKSWPRPAADKHHWLPVWGRPPWGAQPRCRLTSRL